MVGATTAGKTVANTFNAEGLRATKTADGVTKSYCYEYDRVIKELDSSGSVAYNIYGTNLISRQVGNEKVYYLYNGHGDVTAMLTPGGTIVASYYYDAFGVIVEQSGNFSNPYRYAGYIYDEEITLYNLKARYYDAGIARFLQEDTYLGDAQDPLSLNFYTYCKNEPLKYYDPSGHDVAVRAAFSSLGWYVVYYDKPVDWRKIVITNPNTGQSYGIAENEFRRDAANNAIITDAFYNKIVAALTPAPPTPPPPEQKPPNNNTGNNTGTGNQSGSGVDNDKSSAQIFSLPPALVISYPLPYSYSSLNFYDNSSLFSLSMLQNIYVDEVRQDGIWRIIIKLHDENGPVIAELSDTGHVDAKNGSIFKNRDGSITVYRKDVYGLKMAYGSDMNKLAEAVAYNYVYTYLMANPGTIRGVLQGQLSGVVGIGDKTEFGFMLYGSAADYFVGDGYGNIAKVRFLTAGGGMAAGEFINAFYFPTMDNIYNLIEWDTLSISVGIYANVSILFCGNRIGFSLGGGYGGKVGFSADYTFKAEILHDFPSELYLYLNR